MFAVFGEGWGRYFWKCEPQRRKRAWWALCGVWMLRGNIVWKDREAWRRLSYGAFTRVPLVVAVNIETFNYLRVCP